MLYLVLLDDALLADLLVVQTLGRLAAGRALPLAFVHGGGGLVARALEARGVFPGDPLPDDLAGEGLATGGLARAHLAAHRAQTHALARRLTDAGVPAVGVQGTDRRLLVRSGEGGDDAPVEAPGAAWLADLVGRGAVPVVAAVARRVGAAAEEAGVPVPVGMALAALGRALRDAGAEVVVFTTATVDASASDDEALAASSDSAAARAVRAAGVPVRVVSPPTFFAPGGPGGRLIGAD